MLWLIACTNAFNLIDGTDGVASGIGLFATLTMCVAALLGHGFGLVLATAPLAGALLGFLRYNFNPASVFLGDAGSLWIGFVLGCYGVMWSQKSATMLGMTAPLMALSIPLLDTALAVVRRFLRHRPIFSADRGHIHHRLLDRGLTPRRVALLLYGASGLAACFALLQNAVHREYGGVIIILFCAAAWSGVQCLGYQELGIAARLFRLATFRAQIDEQLRLRSFEESLAAASTVEGCWRSIRDAARELGFSSVTLKLGGTSYEEHLEDSENSHWLLRIPLSDSACVYLTRGFCAQEGSLPIATFAEFLHRALEEKTGKLGRETAVPPAANGKTGVPAVPELQWTVPEVQRT
jgi:UDP-GlcNAc:undecaprenyl-phosphate GlcNAc-1-phosphate transferase